MSTLPVMSGREVVRVIVSLGWQVARQSSSHIILTRPGETAIVRGGCRSQAVLHGGGELATLLQHGLPMAFDPQYEPERLVTALQWFLGWHEVEGVEGQFIRLWIVLEMLAHNYWKGKATTPSGKFKQAEQYLQALGIPGVDTLPLQNMYKARNCFVHGDPDLAEAEMSGWFGRFSDARGVLLARWNPSLTNLPTGADYGCCVFEASDMLSRLLEKVFLSGFGCQQTAFYARAPFHVSYVPASTA